MYYYLLDGDWASNACSWQWVAGSNSNKKYYANQENISKFTNTAFQNSLLNVAYDAWDEIVVPKHMQALTDFNKQTQLPQSTMQSIIPGAPLLIYNYYNLDPIWRNEIKGNRVLLLEPDIFDAYPISENCMQFMLYHAKNIDNMQIFVGSFQQLLASCQPSTTYFKEHPFNAHYKGIQDARDWIAPDVNAYFPSFFAYWKKVEKSIKANYF